MPILVDAERFSLSSDELHAALQEVNVIARRYFYPLLTDFGCYQDATIRGDLAVANAAAQRVICLPLYPDLDHETIETISEMIRSLGE